MAIPILVEISCLFQAFEENLSFIALLQHVSQLERKQRLQRTRSHELCDRLHPPLILPHLHKHHLTVMTVSLHPGAGILNRLPQFGHSERRRS